MKEIKDYLPFYLGCECLINKAKSVSKLVGFNVESGLALVVSGDITYWVGPDFIILNLRPLSDMTEEEAKQMDLYGIWDDIQTLSRGDWSGTMFYPDDFPQLLKQGFDLFNLIPEGLAIDKTKQKPQNDEITTAKGL